MNLTFHSTYFMEDDVHDGDYPRDDTVSDYYPDLTVEEAARMIEHEGLTFSATGTDWAANPDGTSIVNYVTGRRVETSAHPDCTPDELSQLIDIVG